MKRRISKSIKQACIISVLLLGVLIIISIATHERPSHVRQSPLISSEVQKYRPLVETYAKEYELTEYVDVLLAMMMQESGGRGTDPMQSSESFCGKRGCIDDPALSIKQGVYYFSQTLQEAKGDLELAIQSYNFGKGFIQYAHRKSSKYSEALAIDFSKEMYDKAANKSMYTCLREEAKQYNACYGDIYYVRSVLAYRDALASN